MTKYLAIVLALSAALFAGCQRKDASHTQTLRLLCGAGLRPAVEEAVKDFGKQTGITVECDYAGSGFLMIPAKVEKTADLFLPGDLWYVEQLQKEGLVKSTRMVTYLVPVILVAKGNPKHITDLADLARPDVRVGIGQPETCQIGRTCEELFKKNGLTLGETQRSENVPELAMWVVTQKVDAAVVWDATAVQYADSTEAVKIDPAKNVVSSVAIGIMDYSGKKELAQKFVDFLAGEEGKAIFRKNGYHVDPPHPLAADGSLK